MKYVISTILFLIVSMTGQAQQPQCVTRPQVLLAKDKPTVYVTFESITKDKLQAKAATTAGTSSINNPLSSIGSNDLVLLRLHNNTHWAIKFTTAGYGYPRTTMERLCDGRGIESLSEGAEVTIYYQVETSPPPFSTYTNLDAPEKKPKTLAIPVIRWPDVASDGWLLPGRSIIFPVKREHLTKDVVVYVTFNYEWETVGASPTVNEPQHRVYFRNSDLSK